MSDEDILQALDAGRPASNAGDALNQTRALAETLMGDKDGKFANSKFLQFVSKMSRGEIILEDNQVFWPCHALLDLQDSWQV